MRWPSKVPSAITVHWPSPMISQPSRFFPLKSGTPSAAAREPASQSAEKAASGIESRMFLKVLQRTRRGGGRPVPRFHFYRRLPGTLYDKMRFLIVAAALAIAACGPSTQARSIPEYGYEVVHTYHHDPLAFTQGLFYLDGYLYEGTGLEEQSSIRKVKLETGEVLEKRDVPGEYFGEGIVNWRDRLLEITWTTHVGFIYDLLSFTPKGQFEYPGEGWGLTQDGKRIIMSDGTPELRFWEPETLKELGRLQVTADGQPVKDLNELEWVKGEIYANVWQTDTDRPHRPRDRQGGGMDRPHQPAESRRPTPSRPTSSTASPTTPRATGCLSPASAGPSYSRLSW